jgi:hypothetical protein
MGFRAGARRNATTALMLRRRLSLHIASVGVLPAHVRAWQALELWEARRIWCKVGAPRRTKRLEPQPLRTGMRQWCH